MSFWWWTTILAGGLTAAGAASVGYMVYVDQTEEEANTVPASLDQADFVLQFPLKCADPQCNTAYDRGPFQTGMMTSLLDHSLASNGNGFWQYGSVGNGRGDGIIVGHDGTRITGSGKPKDDTCLSGDFDLGGLLNTGGCGPGFVSYDEHPGYDYRAAIGTEVFAAAAGTVVNASGQRCIINNMGYSCDDWGMVGIDHGNGLITQYAHMSEIKVAAGEQVSSGQLIGKTGNTSPAGLEITLAPHLHFEALAKSGDEYLVVDPYGWSGPGNDPLYSSGKWSPVSLWEGSKPPQILATLPHRLNFFPFQGVTGTVDLDVKVMGGARQELVFDVTRMDLSYTPNANYNPFPGDQEFDLLLRITPRNECDGCEPGFSRELRKVARFDNGRITQITDGQSYPVYLDEVEGFDVIGITLAASPMRSTEGELTRLLFLNPDDLRVSAISAALAGRPPPQAPASAPTRPISNQIAGNWYDGGPGCLQIQTTRNPRTIAIKAFYCEATQAAAQTILLDYDDTVGAFVDELTGLKLEEISDSEIEIVASEQILRQLGDGIYLAEVRRRFKRD